MSVILYKNGESEVIDYTLMPQYLEGGWTLTKEEAEKVKVEVKGVRWNEEEQNEEGEELQKERHEEKESEQIPVQQKEKVGIKKKKG